MVKNMSSLNVFHLITFVVGLCIVILITVFACKRKLENEKYWIAIIAFVAFSMYCIIDYQQDTAKFGHPCPPISVTCGPPTQPEKYDLQKGK